MKTNQLIKFFLMAVGLLVLPLLLQQGGNAWVRILDMALLYVLLALGLNIVVGYAGLLDLGYVAFFAVGAYLAALLGSPHLAVAFPWIAAAFPAGLHLPIWAVIPLAAALAGLFGMLLGAPTLKLRGDYLAIVTLGFGEIIRIFMNNLNEPLNFTNGPQGINLIDPIRVFGVSLAGESGSKATGTQKCRIGELTGTPLSASLANGSPVSMERFQSRMFSSTSSG